MNCLLVHNCTHQFAMIDIMNISKNIIGRQPVRSEPAGNPGSL